MLHSESILETPLFKKGKSGGFIVATSTSTWSPPDDRENVFCEERVNYIFRDKNTRIARHKPDPSKQQPVKDVDYNFEREPIDLDEALLFRYSALTWNTHKIHYNKEFAQKEGYQDILVHGPLQATLALDFLGEISHRLSPKEPAQMHHVYQLINAFHKQEHMKQWTKSQEEHHKHHHDCQDHDHEPPQFEDIPNPEWHHRFHSLRHFAYKINYPLVANTKVRVLGKVLKDEMDFAEYDSRIASASASSVAGDDFTKPLTIRELTRNKPAYVQVWIQDAEDPSLVYFNSTAVFDAPLDYTYYDVPEVALDKLLSDLHKHRHEM